MKEKMDILQKINERIQRDKWSITKAGTAYGIHRKQYIDWKKHAPAMMSFNPRLKSMTVGRVPALAELNDQLLQFVFEMRERGMVLSTRMIVMKANTLCRTFREKSDSSKYRQGWRWQKRNKLVQRIATHESQKDPRETVSEALDFVQVERSKFSQSCRHQDFLMNMDQTPVPFTFNANRTLEFFGAKTVNVRKSTCDTKRASAR